MSNFIDVVYVVNISITKLHLFILMIFMIVLPFIVYWKVYSDITYIEDETWTFTTTAKPKSKRKVDRPINPKWWNKPINECVLSDKFPMYVNLERS